MAQANLANAKLSYFIVSEKLRRHDHCAAIIVSGGREELFEPV
jgi:hypothetical protein